MFTSSYKVEKATTDGKQDFATNISNAVEVSIINAISKERLIFPLNKFFYGFNSEGRNNSKKYVKCASVADANRLVQNLKCLL